MKKAMEENDVIEQGPLLLVCICTGIPTPPEC